MVLDNIDDTETFFPSQQQGQEGVPVSLEAYLPQSSNGSILITSRNKEAAASLAGGYKAVKEVLAMDEDQGVQLLHNKLLEDKLDTAGKDSTAELVRALDCMPLAITQAAAYINRQALMTAAGYLSEFRASDEKCQSLLHHDTRDPRRDKSASNSVVKTWQVSFEKI
jgi:hypothetical protein